MANLTPHQQQVIEQARSYLDVSWKHQGRTRAHGIDCGGLISCVAYDLGWADVDFRAYSRYPDGKTLRELLSQEMVRMPRDAMQPADVVLLLDLISSRWPCHVGIVGLFADHFTLIHAAADPGYVVENRLSRWWDAKIAGCFRFKQIAVQEETAWPS